MAEEKRKDGKTGDNVESPRKSPRLNLLAAVLPDPAAFSDAVPQELNGDSAEGEFCKHVLMEVGQLNMIVEDVTSSKEPPVCEDCGFDTCKTKAGADGCRENADSIMVCTVCSSRFCSGMFGKGNPMGHARLHATIFRHWVALWFSEPFTGYCFSCKRALTFDGSDGEDEDELSDKMSECEISDGVYELGDDAGGHAPWYEDIYVIRGMPNLGHTCYMNAVVQCLFTLGKLRTLMSGSDAPTGLLGTTLHDLFEETGPTKYFSCMPELEPENLLRAIQDLDRSFVGMQDSHALLIFLLNGLESEVAKQGGDPSAVASIFRVQLTHTRLCNACSNTSVSSEVLNNLSASMPSRGLLTTDKSKAEKVYPIDETGGCQILGLPNLSASLPSEGPPVTSVVSPSMDKGCRSLTKPKHSIFSKSNTQKTQTVAGESLIPGSELGDMVNGNAPKTLQAGSTEVNICQSKEVAHDLLQTPKNDATGEMIEVPINIVDFLPPSLDEKIGGVVETTAKSHDPARIHSLTSIEGGLISNHFKEEKLEDWRCENCAIIQEITTEMSCSENESTSCITANKSPEYREDAQEAVPSCPPAEKNTDLPSPSAHDSQNASTRNQGKGKQVKLDHSAHKKKDNQSKQKDLSTHGIQTTVISGLPPVLIILVKRYAEDGSKLSGHISFKEILDLGIFMNPSSQDKNNSSYRLVGVVEHIGYFSVAGHYVAYVRAGHKQQCSGSSSWFRADDSLVTEVSLKSVLRCEAFLLFYERIGG